MSQLHRLAALIFAASVVISGATDARSERRVALVIGNNEYQQLTPLAKAVADAETYAELFRSKGFDQVTLKTNLTRGAMDEAIAAFAEGIEPGDTAVFSYSGHGWSDGTQNFIIGTDAPNSGSQEFLARISIPLRNGLSGVIDDMDRRGAGLKVALIDACRDNPFAPQPGKRGSGMTRGLARTDPPEGTFVIYSAAAAQSSLDRLSDADTNPNGVFTRVFAPLLASDMSLQEAVKEAQQEVVALARSIQEEQKPAYYDEVIGRACLSASCEVAASASARENTPDEHTWARIAGSSDAADFESFSRIFPDSPHRSEAEARAKALREPGTAVAAVSPQAPSLEAATRLQGVGMTAVADSRGVVVGEVTDPRIVERDVRSGDVIVAIGGMDVGEVADLDAAIASARESGQAALLLRLRRGDAVRFVSIPMTPPDASTATEATFGDSNTVPATECDRLAASPYGAENPEGVTGVGLADLRTNATAAVAACREDVARYPSVRRLLFQLGRALYEGDQVDEAKTWYEEAADLGDLTAMNNLANLYRETDPAAAVRLFRQAGEAGLTPAMINLGSLYASGTTGLEQNYEEARTWYRKAAELGDVQGMNSLANLYETGAGGEVDYTEARVWYEKAADLGDSNGMTSLADLYANGNGVTQDYAEAVRLFQSAVALGDSGAMYRLGQLYLEGKGVLRDDGEARRLFQQSTDLQNILAVTELGLMAAAGRGGPKDVQLGADSLIRAMEIGIQMTFERMKAEAESLDPEVWRALQRYLAEKSLYSAAPDGIYGETTQAALDAYQEAQRRQ